MRTTISDEVSEISNGALINELYERYDSHELVEKDIKEIRQIFSISNIPNESMEDQMKLDFLAEHWQNFSSSDLEKLLK